MCATVCPSQALAFTTREEIEQTRRGKAINEWHFGDEVVRTKVFVMVPETVSHIDVGLVTLRAKKDGEPVRTEPTYDVAVLLEGG